MSQTQHGRIVKAVGGFYYVEAADTVLECRARGIFRKEKQSPLVGDRVRILVPDNGMAMVEEIEPRKNSLIRPPLANLDQLVIVLSVADPAPNLLVADKLIAIAERKGIEPALIITKIDLGDAGPIEEIYRRAGFPVACVSTLRDEGLEPVYEMLAGKFSAFTGNSGAGKSSLLNRLDPRLGLPTGDISHKLGRGRHTTRHVELYSLPGDACIADTPGFSSLDLERCEPVLAADLPDCFREFAPYFGRCRFTSCSHTGEKGCAVAAAVEAGEITRSRYDNYRLLYEAVRNVKEWELHE